MHYYAIFEKISYLFEVFVYYFLLYAFIKTVLHVTISA